MNTSTSWEAFQLNILEFHRMCTILCCDASPIGIYWQRILLFDKLVCRIIKERLSACHMATVTEIILISEFHALH